MIPTLKHFPGIELSKVDPHEDNYEIPASYDQLFNNDLDPFRQVIEQVDNKQLMMMVSHLKYPAYDSKNPSSTAGF